MSYLQLFLNIVAIGIIKEALHLSVMQAVELALILGLIQYKQNKQGA
jgi:hypothetical protein